VKELVSERILNTFLILVLKFSFRSQNLTSVGFLREIGLTGLPRVHPFKGIPVGIFPLIPSLHPHQPRLVALSSNLSSSSLSLSSPWNLDNGPRKDFPL
jgi:hypothetical protein